jgi:hypothetical protein
MTTLESAVASATDRPLHMDELVARQEIPGTGEMPEALVKLARENRQYFYSTGAEAPLVEKHPSADKRTSCWSIALGDQISEGLPGLSAVRIDASDIKAKKGESADLESVRPDWATVSFLPRLSVPRPVKLLRRRNGRLVMPEFVNGNDDRVVTYPATWPWYLAGRVDVSVKPPGGSSWIPLWLGSGALVGKRVVVTASHMVPWGYIDLGFSWRMKFTPGYYNGSSTLGSGIYSYVQTVRGYPDYGQGDDMAILKLYTPLGESLGYFGYKTYDDDWEGGAYWTLIGYPGSVTGAERPTCQNNIVIMDDDSDGEGIELEHNGDTSSGNSGGPLWAWWGDSPRVIGTHSGEEHNWDEDNNVAAGGSALSKLIKWGRDNW